MPFIHLFGLSETQFNCCVSDKSTAVPHYTIYRCDIVKQGKTGLALYVHNSIQNITTRRTDLESQCIESLWVEICNSKTLSLLVGYVYRHPAVTYEWYDEFVTMLDKVSESKNNVLLLGDFNIDLLKPHLAWESTFSILGLNQLITQPARVTCSTNTLIDHIDNNNPNLVHSISVPNIAISDHFPVLCTWSITLPRRPPQGHTTIHYITFKRFNEDAFLFYLSCAPFCDVYKFDNPDDALSVWYDIIMPIINVHAPLRKKRVKHPNLPPWLTSDVIIAMAVRDRLQKSKKDFSISRNIETSLVRSAKKSYFDKLIELDKSTSTIWKAISEITNKSHNKMN